MFAHHVHALGLRHEYCLGRKRRLHGRSSGSGAGNSPGPYWGCWQLLQVYVPLGRRWSCQTSLGVGCDDGDRPSRNFFRLRALGSRTPE